MAETLREDIEKAGKSHIMECEGFLLVLPIEAEPQPIYFSQSTVDMMEKEFGKG